MKKQINTDLVDRFTCNAFFVRWLGDAYFNRQIDKVGFRVLHRERLPKTGPAILIANHTCYADPPILQRLWPRQLLHTIRPVGAKDYFAQGWWLYWFGRSVLKVLMIERGSGKRAKAGEDIFHELHPHLSSGGMIVYFPQGRLHKENEQFLPFKKGIVHLAAQYPEVPIVPFYISGASEMFPEVGDWPPRPHPVSVVVGEPLYARDLPSGTASEQAVFLETRMRQLERECENIK